MRKVLFGAGKWFRRYRRITVDIDILDEYEIATALKILYKYGFNKNVEVKLSPSGKGYHIIAWRDKGISLKKLLKIRSEAGDDPARIWFDSLAGREINVLFDIPKRQREITFEQLMKEVGK